MCCVHFTSVHAVISLLVSAKQAEAPIICRRKTSMQSLMHCGRRASVIVAQVSW